MQKAPVDPVMQLAAVSDRQGNAFPAFRVAGLGRRQRWSVPLRSSSAAHHHPESDWTLETSGRRGCRWSGSCPRLFDDAVTVESRSESQTSPMAVGIRIPPGPGCKVQASVARQGTEPGRNPPVPFSWNLLVSGSCPTPPGHPSPSIGRLWSHRERASVMTASRPLTPCHPA